jgi:hypothetical protein
VTVLASAWCELVERGVSEDAVVLARSIVSKFLISRVVDRRVIEYYVRKALRSGAWFKLKQESRALILATRFLPVVKSLVLKSILRELFLEIELCTLRGKAVFYGVLVALRQGLVEALGDLKRLITLGVGYLNLPVMWRILG